MHVANLGSPDQKIARRAEDCLIRYYGSRALEPLIEACADANSQVRDRAVWALGKTHDPALTKPSYVSQAIPMVSCVTMLPMPSASWEMPAL